LKRNNPVSGFDLHQQIGLLKEKHAIKHILQRKKAYICSVKRKAKRKSQ